MTAFVIINIVLMSALVIGIVGMLGAAIHTSRSHAEVRPVTPRVPRQRPARARAYRSYEGLNA